MRLKFCIYFRNREDFDKKMSKTGTGANNNNSVSSGSGAGLGPAGCWVTHKRLESWARVAKERAISCTSPTILRNGSPHTSGSTNSLSSEVIFSIYLACICMDIIYNYDNTF